MISVTHPRVNQSETKPSVTSLQLQAEDLIAVVIMVLLLLSVLLPLFLYNLRTVWFQMVCAQCRQTLKHWKTKMSLVDFSRGRMNSNAYDFNSIRGCRESLTVYLHPFILVRHHGVHRLYDVWGVGRGEETWGVQSRHPHLTAWCLLDLHLKISELLGQEDGTAWAELIHTVGGERRVERGGWRG